MSELSVHFSDGVISISGPLDRHTVKSAYEKANVYFNGSQKITIDLTDVARTDSAGLALLLAWVRRSRTQEVTLTFINLPEKMKELGRVSGLDQILSLSK
ncbi:MAG: anti-anti-sigma factor [Legionellales bacterium]|nr:anti-anti-sigma factor [Legionellales bacterium]|tara:strand:- start:307 stop:606 length:300 start_codon:yes stop_codon:yes gene_type:complete